MSKPNKPHSPLLELIDLRERAKDAGERDWGSNAQAEPSFRELKGSCKLSYGGRFKNLRYRRQLSFTYYYN